MAWLLEFVKDGWLEGLVVPEKAAHLTPTALLILRDDGSTIKVDLADTVHLSEN